MPSARLAFLGPRGTFSEQAARRYAPAATLVEAPSIAAVMEAAMEGTADSAIVPIENSWTGSVIETLDLLLHTVDRLRVCGEWILPIEQCLIGPPGTELSTVRTIYSHPQGLAQCREFIARELPQARTQASLSTAGAVADALQAGQAVAIAPRGAAALHDAAILRAGVEDDARNQTRFVVLAGEDALPSGDDKTSLALNTQDAPGALVRALQPFAEAGIDLSKIESRPAREELGVYIFLVDCAGHRLDPALAAVLEQVAEVTTQLRVFGSYPRFRGG